MADVIKGLAKRSAEALTLAIDKTLNKEEKKRFEQNLEVIAACFQEIPTKEQKTEDDRRKVPSGGEIFKERILPQIRTALLGYEEAEVQQTDLEIGLTLEHDVFGKITSKPSDLKSIEILHAKIIEQEKKQHLYICS